MRCALELAGVPWKPWNGLACGEPGEGICDYCQVWITDNSPSGQPAVFVQEDRSGGVPGRTQWPTVLLCPDFPGFSPQSLVSGAHRPGWGLSAGAVVSLCSSLQVIGAGSVGRAHAFLPITFRGLLSLFLTKAAQGPALWLPAPSCSVLQHSRAVWAWPLQEHSCFGLFTLVGLFFPPWLRYEGRC